MQPSEEGSQSSLGGGGRYDGLAELLGGPPTPGIGFGTGIERLIINLKRDADGGAKVAIDTERSPALFIAHLTPEAGAAALQLARRVRERGLTTLVGGEGRSLKAQMRHADAKGARYVAIIGADEFTAGEVTLREMSSHVERRVKFDDVAAAIAPP
jgi:histidyl-tRNA synthetase